MAVHCKKIVSGGVGIGDMIANEIPSGDINSHNTEFSIQYDPVAGTVEVYLNGLLQTPGTGGDYTISGKNISFIKPPRTNSEILVSYAKQII